MANLDKMARRLARKLKLVHDMQEEVRVRLAAKIRTGSEMDRYLHKSAVAVLRKAERSHDRYERKYLRALRRSKK